MPLPGASPRSPASFRQDGPRAQSTTGLRRDDDFVASRLAAERTLAAVSYEAWARAWGGDVPQRRRTASAAESALTDDS